MLATSPAPAYFVSLIDYLHTDHSRQRVLCQMIDEIAQERDAECVSAVLRFPREDFETHIQDEEALLPLPRRCAAPGDLINDILGELRQEHAADTVAAKPIAVGFSKARFSRSFRKMKALPYHRKRRRLATCAGAAGRQRPALSGPENGGAPGINAGASHGAIALTKTPRTRQRCGAPGLGRPVCAPAHPRHRGTSSFHHYPGLRGEAEALAARGFGEIGRPIAMCLGKVAILPLDISSLR